MQNVFILVKEFRKFSYQTLFCAVLKIHISFDEIFEASKLKISFQQFHQEPKEAALTSHMWKCFFQSSDF